jgi:RNA polymerase sigma factor for flagellar operon FliA
MTDHPTELTLQRFADGRGVDLGARSRTAAHVQTCERCRRAVRYHDAVRTAVRGAEPSDPPALSRGLLTRVVGRLRASAPLRVSSGSGPAAKDAETVLLDNLRLLDRLTRVHGRRCGWPTAEAEAFGAWVRARLVDGDFALLRKSGVERALETYFTVMIAMLSREYERLEWSEWHAARGPDRSGPPTRDHPRHRPWAALLAPSPWAADPPVPPERGHVNTGAPQRGVIDAALQRAIEDLSPEDQVLLRLRSFDGCTVADVALSLGVPERPLYRRLERLLRDVRTRLEAGGISREVVRASLRESNASCDVVRDEPAHLQSPNRAVDDTAVDDTAGEGDAGPVGRTSGSGKR